MSIELGIIGDGIDHCPVCSAFDPPRNTSCTPLAVVPQRAPSMWAMARYRHRRCGYGWWRPWPKHVPTTPDPPKAKPRKRARA